MDELLPFLKHERPDVREAAAEHVAGLAADPASRTLLRSSDGLMKILSRLTGDLPGPKLAAFRALVLLTSGVLARGGGGSSSGGGEAEGDASYFVREALAVRIEERCWNELDGEPETVDLALGVLANVSRTETGAAALLLPPRAGRRSGLADAVRHFLDSGPGTEWDNVALLLNNVSQLPAGRRFIKPEWFAEELTRTAKASPARRRGVAGALRNIAQASDGRRGGGAEALLGAGVVAAVAARLPRETDPDVLIEYLGALRSIASSSAEGRAECLAHEEQLGNFTDLMSLPSALRQAIVALRGELRDEDDEGDEVDEINALCEEMDAEAMD